MPAAPVLAAAVLATPRLTLRPHVPADFADSAALWGDPAVVEHIGGVPSSPAEVWTRLLGYAGSWTLLGFGYWCVRESATGRFVGEAGLADFKRDLDPPLGDAPEAGWALSPWAHGRGYGREAVGAVLGWADAVLAAPRTVCLIAPENAASIRLAQAQGFSPYALARYREREVRLFERPAALRA